MAVARSWYLTCHGRYESGEWAGEIAQVGIRGTATESGGYFAPVVSAPLGEFQALPDGEIEQTTDFDIQWGWRGATVLTKDHQKQMASIGRTFMDAVKSLQINTGWKWTEVRIAALDANGDYVNGASIFELRTPISGTGGQQGLPQNCVVASLRSGGRTARTRGRMYIPMTGAAVASGGIVSATVIGTAGNAVKALATSLDGVNADIYPGIVSQTYNTWSTITRVSVGDEVDTQRRRRYARTEKYTDFQP